VGCFRAAPIQPDGLEMYSESDISVSTRDGRKYEFSANQHAVISDENGNKAIRGKAKVFAGTGPQFLWFDGDVLFQDILRISTPEKTDFYYVALVTSGVVLVLIVYMATLFRGNFGG
jgi:hypothetical protein